MPITEAERKKITEHTFSEDVSELDSARIVAPNISSADSVMNGIKLAASKPSSFILNIPGGLIFAFYAFALLRSSSLLHIILYTLAFFILEIFVAAPLSAASKSRFMDSAAAGYTDSMVISLIYLEPLVPAFFLILLVLAIKSLSSSLLYVIAFLLIFVVTLMLYILNLDSSIAVNFLHDKNVKRDKALNRSWIFLSGQSLSVMSVNIAVSLPLAVAVMVEGLLAGTPLAWYFLPIVFILADFSASWWQACTSYIYRLTLKKARPSQHSRL